MGQAYLLLAAPMGFTLSPWWFTWAMQCPLTYIRKGGVVRDAAGGDIDPIPAIAWLDDFLVGTQLHFVGWVLRPRRTNKFFTACAWSESRTTRRKSSNHVMAGIGSISLPAASRATPPRRMYV